jgi:hypothetical protein
VLGRMLKGATSEERDRYFATLSTSQGTSVALLTTAAGGVVVANLAGFGFYVAASSVLGALSSAAGIVLPFAVYTGMSSALALLIGPVGWGAIAVWTLFKVGAPNYRRTLPGVVAIAAARSRLIAERDAEIGLLREEFKALMDRERILESQLSMLNSLRTRSESGRISRSDVPWLHSQ